MRFNNVIVFLCTSMQQTIMVINFLWITAATKNLEILLLYNVYQDHFYVLNLKLLFSSFKLLKFWLHLTGSSREASELADINWDNLGFGLVPTDYMYMAKCSQNGTFSKGELQRFGPIELSPSSGVLNYGQVWSTYDLILVIIKHKFFV